MSSSGPDLFVVCKHCGSEVSPYITECPYCGSRLRKRAPKLDRDGRPAEPLRARAARSKLTPLRRGEIPGIRADARPWATIALVVAPIIVVLLARADVINLLDLVVIGPLDNEWWRALTAPFAYGNLGYLFIVVLATAIFGWLLERRHGPLPVLLLFLAAGVVGMLAAGAFGDTVAAGGGNGAALALLCAWAVPPLVAMRRGDEIDADMLGVLVFALTLLALPIAISEASPIAGVVGALMGLAFGVPLARVGARS